MKTREIVIANRYGITEVVDPKCWEGDLVEEGLEEVIIDEQLKMYHYEDGVAKCIFDDRLSDKEVCERVDEFFE